MTQAETASEHVLVCALDFMELHQALLGDVVPPVSTVKGNDDGG